MWLKDQTKKKKKKELKEILNELIKKKREASNSNEQTLTRCPISVHLVIHSQSHSPSSFSQSRLRLHSSPPTRLHSTSDTRLFFYLAYFMPSYWDMITSPSVFMFLFLALKNQRRLSTVTLTLVIIDTAFGVCEKINFLFYFLIYFYS